MDSPKHNHPIISGSSRRPVPLPPTCSAVRPPPASNLPRHASLTSSTSIRLPLLLLFLFFPPRVSASIVNDGEQSASQCRSDFTVAACGGICGAAAAVALVIGVALWYFCHLRPKKKQAVVDAEAAASQKREADTIKIAVEHAKRDTVANHREDLLKVMMGFKDKP